MSQLHGHYLSLPHSSLRSRFPSSPSLHLYRAAFSSTNRPPLSLSLNSTKPTVSCPLTVVRSRFSEPGEDSFSDITPQYELSKTQDKQKPQKLANGIFLIILTNLAIFMAEHFYQVRWIKSLYLYSDFPVWYQFVTAAFCHANWNHLSSNLFFLYIFGKIVEEEIGSFGLWMSYLYTGLGANLVSWLVLPSKSASAGASGAVCGLFLISVFLKMSRDWRKFLEVLILGQFVLKRVYEAAQGSAGLLETIFGGFTSVIVVRTLKPIAQFSGALAGVLLLWLLSKFPSEQVKKILQK
ncbi:PREDICTED: rhomboid-like protein 11, chloroplastic [Camelina sativa]|uniref:Rhomboid-like protein 11, chloroplastic n=1 Tax=Camelina sativa TaxID=90675 RepID=A0ABM0T642_CAMSA|nr:PREDICTED: rhomboid-like protein 11, chloroplastic [Camelina sativa]